MDVVYTLRAGDNEELRYSLRSLVNLPHDEVWLIGGGHPGWIQNVKHVRFKPSRDRFKNTTAYLAAACRDERISDPFLLMNDDFFIMQPTDPSSVVNLGPIGKVIERFESERGNSGSKYVTDMYETRQMLLDMGFTKPLSYESHTPLLVHKAEMLLAIELLRAAGLKGAHKRSIYGNMALEAGHRIDDVKVFSEDCDIPDGQFLSSTEEYFDRVLPILREAFPERCRYEDNTTLTAVVTNHDYGRYLKRCLDSALLYCDEVLVYDDGSTDDSMEVLASYGEKVTVTHRDRATGDPVWGSTLGIYDATGTHLIFLDADNYLVSRPPTDAVDYTFGAIQVVNDDEKEQTWWRFNVWPLTADRCWRSFADRAARDMKPLMPFPWGGVWKTSFLKGKVWRRFDSTSYAADLRTALDWCKSRPTLAYAPTPFLAFRKHGGQWSGSPERAKMLAEARQVIVLEKMPPVMPTVEKELRLGVNVDFNGRHYRRGEHISYDVACAMRDAGLIKGENL